MSSDPASTVVAGDRARWDAVFPLGEFYARAGRPLPDFEIIDGATVPEPYRRLLVHENDMTPTLEDYYGGDIRIEVLGRERRGDAYFREVILRLEEDQRPVEFGANKVSLEWLPPIVRRLVLEEYLPFGHILKAHDVPHWGRPTAFFRMTSDDVINRAFGLEGCQVLYGRRNTIRDPRNRPLSEIVEILPP